MSKRQREPKLNGKARELKAIAERDPFRPFALRLTNGQTYKFREQRDWGAPRDFHVIVYFDSEGGLSTIYADEISEILTP